MLFLQTSAVIAESWVVPYGLNGSLWTLSEEFFFYCFFPFAFLFNNKHLKALHVNLKFFLLLILSGIALAINKIVYIPYLIFFSGFIMWLLGYVCSLTFLTGKRYTTLFLGITFCAILFLTLGFKILPSDTFAKTCKGMIVATLFYSIIFLSSNQVFSRITKWPADLISTLFYW